MSEEEIKKMVRDAEEHADEDKKKREQVTAKNNLDNLVYSCEKSLADLGDKVPAEDRTAVESAMERAKKALESNDYEEIKAANEALSSASHKMAEQAYQKATAGAQAAGGATPGGEEKPADDNVVDADFEEVKN